MGNFWSWLPNIQQNTMCCIDTRTRQRSDKPKFIKEETELKKKEELWYEDTH
jgi:hypothetical protein